MGDPKCGEISQIEEEMLRDMKSFIDDVRYTYEEIHCLRRENAQLKAKLWRITKEINSD